MVYDAFPKWQEALLRLTFPRPARRVPNMENFNGLAAEPVENLVSVASDDFYANVWIFRSPRSQRAVRDKLYTCIDGQQHIASTT
jgi:hypothetical protein